MEKKFFEIPAQYMKNIFNRIFKSNFPLFSMHVGPNNSHFFSC